MTTRNEYDPGSTDAATLAAFLALGARIDALQWELQAQRERADDYQRKVLQLARRVAVMPVQPEENEDSD